MKKFYILSLLLSVMFIGSCQKLQTESTAPYVTTSYAENITATSAVLYGSYNSMFLRTSGDLMCYFAVSEYRESLEDFSYIHHGEYDGDVKVYTAEMSTVNVESHDTWCLQLNGLSPDTDYYYIYALVFKGAEVKGSVERFTTIDEPPHLVYFDIDMDGCYCKDGYVYYNIFAEMDGSLMDYADGQECGIFVRSSDGQYEQYIPCVEDGSTFTVKAAVPKSMYDLYPSTWFSWANTGSMEYGIYIKEHDTYNILYREIFEGFSYSKQPSITFTYLNQTSDENYYSENWDRKAGYKYTVEVSGALFMEQIYESYLGNWSDNVTDYFYEDIYDGSYSFSYNFFYSSTSILVNYIEVNAILSNYSILPSDNCIAFYAAFGICDIELYNGSDRQNSIARTSVLNTDEKMGVAMTDRLSQY